MPPTQPAVYHLALTGYPLGHSLSPLIHSAALRACGLDGEYTLRPVPPEQIDDGLQTLASEMRAGKLHGLNITIPHKQVIGNICDVLTPAAQKIGAVNLLSLQGDKIIGDNSDARGFMAALAPQLAQWGERPLRALVLGAGGSARAVIYALASSGWEVIVSSRRLEQATKLVAELSPAAVKLPPAASEFSSDPEFLASLDLVVNTTPLGMSPNPFGCPWPESLPLPLNAVIYDLVYNPRETTLIKLAVSQGLPVIGGITMLVEQAAIAFECWTGYSAPREAMYASVR